MLALVLRLSLLCAKYSVTFTGLKSQQLITPSTFKQPQSLSGHPIHWGMSLVPALGGRDSSSAPFGSGAAGRLSALRFLSSDRAVYNCQF